MKRLILTLRSMATFAVVTVFGAISVSGGAALAVGHQPYFDVPKNSPQRVCYKQLDVGWKALGFKNLNHCLRYVTTDAPEEKADCNGGWWFVYGFNKLSECKDWVVEHGGGGYDGDADDAY